MLKLAFPYREKLNQAWQSIAFDEKYQFYNGGGYWSYDVKLDDNSWDNIQMVSVDKDDNVIGYLSARIDRQSNKVSSVGAINFKDRSITFSKDFYRFLTELFTKHHFRKIEWYVIVGNPAEKMYDKIVTKYGGRMVGVRCESTMTADGILRDEKEYEIFRSNYDLISKKSARKR